MVYSSFCGIKCKTCPLYIATVNNDDDLKLTTVKKWNLYKEDMPVSEIACSGCKSENVFVSCQKCDIKQCNQSKDISCCNECCTYPCKRVDDFYKYQISNKTCVHFESYVIV